MEDRPFILKGKICLKEECIIGKVTVNRNEDDKTRYIQILDDDRGWCTSQSSAYVETRSYCSGYVHNSTTGKTTQEVGDEEIRTIYSPNYYNKTTRKTDAVIAYLNYYIEHDATGDVCFRHQNKVLFTLYEEFGMEPFFP